MMLCLVASMAFAACGEDNPTEPEVSIIGEWELEENSCTDNYIFYADGKYVHEFYEEGIDWVDVEEGTYEYSGDIIEFYRNEPNQYGTDYYIFIVLELTKNKLVINDEKATYVYYRVDSYLDRDDSDDGSGSSDGSGENSDISGDQLAKYIIGTWKDINSYYEDNRYYFLQDGNGYVEHSVAYDGVYRAAFQWAVEDDVVSIVYIGGSEYKYNVVIDSETMELTNTKNGKTTTYNKINNNGTTSVDYRNPPFVNYVEMYGNYYPLSKAIMRCKHAVGTNANMKHLQFFGDNEELTPMGVWFTYSTPYYEGINKEWSDGTYSIKSDSGFWIYSGAYCYRGTTYNGAGTLKIKTVNSVKVFDFTLDGGDIVGHLEGNWSYD